MTTSMFGRYTDCGDVSGMIRFLQADHKSDHRAIRCYDAVCNRFGRSQEVLESIAAVGLAIDEATLIQPPAFIELRDAQRANVVSKIRCQGNNVGGLCRTGLTVWFGRL